jgi:hypothetical protein
VAILHQGMAAHVAHVRLYSANDYVYRSPRESRRCNLGRRPRLNGRKSKSLLMCYAGARRWAIANTLIQTCKLSGIKGIRDLKPP